LDSIVVIQTFVLGHHVKAIRLSVRKMHIWFLWVSQSDGLWSQHSLPIHLKVGRFPGTDGV